ELGRVRPSLVDGMAAGLDVGRIETVLSKGPKGAVNPAGLLHGDFWAGNLLWQNGKLVAVVDWEDAAMGDPLVDLGKARVELVWLFGVEAADRFTEYYRTMMAIDMANLPYWDLCAVLRLLRLVKGNWGWLVDFVKGYGREDVMAERIGQGFELFVEGVIGNWLIGGE
ncbi:MAG: aminoglycoside phosphotransferase family protein, partial [Candidatus Promineifilaceae bacterium]